MAAIMKSTESHLASRMAGVLEGVMAMPVRGVLAGTNGRKWRWLVTTFTKKARQLTLRAAFQRLER
ncbi:MAG: hypothetical protein KAF64_15525 [Hydrogenophaga sp.]|uniref:hypothetical protein n=1 Tax=Hydrogenophaga sp. TaxID=1904254 RepID=UPI0025BE66E5|nr:hypothetical protein [Hydrogenophaga sp.]MBU7574766.1 hypothetical protein [Hydrogenophaga sp.]